MPNPRLSRLFVVMLTVTVPMGLVYRRPSDAGGLPNRIPEAAPYVISEAQFVPPPFEDYWATINHPGQCQSCHARVFSEWNGSMMANAWRDPAWRAAFLLSARETSTAGDCEAPDPPDGTARAHHNPFALAGTCASAFDLKTGAYRSTRNGSLVDGMCSRCHMPTNYVDNVPLRNVTVDPRSGLEDATVDPRFDPTSHNGTGLAFATVDAQFRNTESGKSGVSCMVCHSDVQTRETPFHNQARAASAQTEYQPALGTGPRATLVTPSLLDILAVPDPLAANLGYGVGGGSFRLSPHAIGFPERVGPLTHDAHKDAPDRYLGEVFKSASAYQQMDASKHQGYRQELLTRAEFCSECHDVTNPLTITNSKGRWVGGFPIERTYAEWAASRYADRPGNRNFDPAFKRDCQTCHMQQDYGQPGTAQTLYHGASPVAPLVSNVATNGAPRTYFSHHFVGGNAYVTRILGADTDDAGNVQPYPELSAFSFSSADDRSVYSNAYWTGGDRRGAMTQQARLAWDRLRNVLDLDLSGPALAAPGSEAALHIVVTNSGSGHKFPTGFPEGRTAWLSVRAFDLGSGRELLIHDAVWQRTSLGVGRLTTEDRVDPNFPGCNWKIPAGSPDPYAYQFKAVASLGDGCPTLDLVYAAPLNLNTNSQGLPIDKAGAVIGRDNPRGLPVFSDLNGDGDLYDDAFLRDSRLRPLPMKGSSAALDRYSVVVPPDADGPIAVVAAVYYQSLEAIVAKKFLGNLADTDGDFVLEPCVLGGPCDGRTPSVEPAVVEGAPPVPMEVRNWVIQTGGSRTGRAALHVSTYPLPGASRVYQDAVIKATFAEPVHGVNRDTFRLTDAAGAVVPASVDQIGDGTWALFPNQVFLEPGAVYQARISSGVCGVSGACVATPITWRFTVSETRGEGSGNTSVPLGFPARTPPIAAPPSVTAVAFSAQGEAAQLTFERPVMNITPLTLTVRAAVSENCRAAGAVVPGRLSSNIEGDVWTFRPERPFDAASGYCVVLGRGAYDLAGAALPPSAWRLRPPGPHR